MGIPTSKVFVKDNMQMLDIWKELPVDLVDRICNLLPKLRAIPLPLKNEITSQQHMLSKYARNWIDQFYFGNGWVAVWSMLGEFEDRPDIGRISYEKCCRDFWNTLTLEERLEFVKY